MATKSISQLDTQATANETDLFEVAIVDQNSASGYASKKESAAAIADAIVGQYQYPLRITGTTAKTIAGAINELKNLVDLLPQFAIEVVQTLPVSDISTTTIYLVPTQDPEQGNYYEEYIYVNNAWELVGTTAVDLSGYYTSAQTDTLLAAKANSADLATVATSGAYSDLSGKPTIDTALDTTSTNAVENRAVASEINSIKSDITVEGSASGDIATFVDGSDNPLRALTISIVATQSGSGDPSPTNERPISGFDSVVISRTATNVWDEEWEEGAYNSNNGAKVNASNRIRCKNPIRVVPNATYYFKSSSLLSIYAYDQNGNYLSRINVLQNNTLGMPSNAYFITFNTGVDSGSTYNNDISINYPSTDTTYHAYNGNTYNISWENEAGTVYGGTLDVKNGVLTVTHAFYNYDGSDDEHWYRYNAGSASSYAMWITTRDNIEIGAQSPLLKCNYLKPVPTNSSWGNYDYFVSTLNVNNRMYTGYRSITTVENWKAYLAEHPLQVLCKLDTPQVYQLSPVEIRSLLGQNNIWADCGEITELKYTRDLNLCINDIIARIEALEGGSNSRSLSLSPTLTKSLTSELDTAEGKTEEGTEEETKEEAQNER